MRYAFVRWDDGLSENQRMIDLLTDVVLTCIYEKMGTVIMSGEVRNGRTDEPLPNETVTITITKPDESIVTLTGLTDAAGRFSIEYSDYYGNYKAKACVPETDTHLAGCSDEVAFTMGKDPVVITLTVSPV